MSNTMILHAGRQATIEEIRRLPDVAGTHSWFPTSHATVIDVAKESLKNSGFEIRRENYGLARDDHRMFATFDLVSMLQDGVSLSVGVRNSTDKTFPLGFCAGSRVFVCDNLAFTSELVVKKKHTRYGNDRFLDGIHKAIASLSQFQSNEIIRIDRMQKAILDKNVASAIILNGYEAGIISARNIDKVIAEWRSPTFEDFEARTAWSLFNSFTFALKGLAKSNPQRFASQTMKLQSLFDSFLAV